MKVSQRGFSVVEAFVVIVVIALVGGVGYVAYHRHQTKNASSNKTANQTAQVQPGTAASVDNLVLQDGTDESAIDSKYTSTYQTNAQSTDQAASNVGGAYNESNL